MLPCCKTFRWFLVSFVFCFVFCYLNNAVVNILKPLIFILILPLSLVPEVVFLGIPPPWSDVYALSSSYKPAFLVSYRF